MLCVLITESKTNTTMKAHNGRLANKDLLTKNN